MPELSPSELQAALRALANRWAMKANEFARDAKANAEKNPPSASYSRGVADGYYKAATDLANLLKNPSEMAPPPRTGSIPTRAASAAPNAAAAAPPAAAAPAAAPAASYAAMELGDVLSMLAFAGLNPRDVMPGRNNAFVAIFSKWENVQPHERVDAIKRVDPRLVVLNTGRTREGNDHFIEFAFRSGA
jgi:hypothetical protein